MADRQAGGLRRRVLRPGTWPLTVKVPMFVAALMVVVATAISNVVLSRLESIQSEQLRQLTDTYLEGLATALQPHVSRRDVWEAFDALDRARTKYAGLAVLKTVVVLPDDTILAASDPVALPVGTKVSEVFRSALRSGTALQIDATSARARAHRRITDGQIWLAGIVAELDISDLLATRSQTLLTLIALNALLTLGAAGLGYWIVRRMLRPVGILSDHLTRARAGALLPVAARELPPEHTELGQLLRRYNALVAAVDEREALARRLADEEKAAMVGKLASGMAHEINNPLGGMFNAVAMIRQHGEDPTLRDRAARLLERGLTGIRNIVRATLVLHKGQAEQKLLSGADIDDIRDLIQSEIERRGLRIEWRNQLARPVPIDAQAVRQIALNLLLNACSVSPAGAAVGFVMELSHGCLIIDVRDQGPGLGQAPADLLCGKGPVGVPASGGLGLWTVRRLLGQTGGGAEVFSDSGCRIRVRIPLQPAEALDAVA